VIAIEFTSQDGLLLGIIVLLLIMLALLAVAETGINRISRIKAESIAHDDPRRGAALVRLVAEPEKFLAEVLAREEVHTTLMERGVAFPHTRTDLVPEITLGIGRSVAGVPFGESSERAHLIFVIGAPKRMVNRYLGCVGALARLTKAEATRAALMKAESAAEFVEILRAGSLLLD